MKKKLVLIFVISTLLAVANNAFSYVHMFGKKQRLIKWPSSTSVVNFSFNTSNNSNLTNSEVTTIITNSANEWRNKSALQNSVQATPNTDTKGVNDIYFSNDPSLFNGTSVAGVTLMQFKENTSEIIESDILINDNMFFEKTPENYNFLGNVITHEIGHALGLGHSLVSGATMFYSLTFGQYKTDADDSAGLFSLYPNPNLNKSEITGKIIGGDSLIPIFGTHVQAYSKKTGAIAAGAISDTDGTFKIMGLDRNDTYYIYTGPAQNLGANLRYARARTDFCEASQSYRGSFFQACNKSLNGHPQAVSLNNKDSHSVGNITVRCGLDTPAKFLDAKTSGTNYEFLSDLNINSPRSFVGYFTKNEVDEGVAENTFSIDLSDVDLSPFSNNHFIKLKIRSQSFQSPLGFDVSYTNGTNFTDYTGVPYSVNSDYFNTLDKDIYLPINPSEWSDKLFTFSIRPHNVQVTSQGKQSNNGLYYPGGIADHETMFFYLVDTSIVQLVGSVYQEIETFPAQTYDNSYCADAKNTYQLTAQYLNGNQDEETRNYDKATSCGSIDLDGKGPGDSGFGLMLGLLLTVLVAKIKSVVSRLYPSKHVGRIA